MVVVNRMRWGQTVVPNAFIDRYMTRAGGEFVKIYIMLLRLMDEEALSVAMLADRLELTEKDVMRGLSYWEKEGLLRLCLAEDGQLASMTILELPEEKTQSVAEEGVSIVFSEEIQEAVREDAFPAIEAAGAGDTAFERAPEGISEPLKAAEDDENFKQAVYVSEKYLGRTLTRKDLELFNRMYCELGFSAELIEYLVEYCVDGGHKTNRYMEAVADGWKAEDIKTVEQAKAQSAAWQESHKKSGTEKKEAAPKKSGNKFHNFDQRSTDYNAILQEEARQNGSYQSTIR